MKALNKGRGMASVKKNVSSLVTFSKPGSRKLAGMLKAPLSSSQKQSIRKSAGKYSLHSEKWKTIK